MSVFESIRLYFSLADSGLLGEMFDKAFERNRDTSTELFVRDSCLELLRAMLPYVDQSRVKRLYDSGMSELNNKDHKIQKRSYRTLEEICGSNSSGFKLILNNLIFHVMMVNFFQNDISPICF